MKTKLLLAVLATASFLAHATAQNLQVTLKDGTKEVWVIDWDKIPAFVFVPDPPRSAEELLSSLKHETNYDAVLVQLATSGEICRVRGHAWGQHFDGFEQFAVVRPDGYQERVCSVCGKFESRSMQPWPTPGPVPMPWQQWLINTNGIIQLTNIFWTNAVVGTNSTLKMYQDAKP